MNVPRPPRRSFLLPLVLAAVLAGCAGGGGRNAVVTPLAAADQMLRLGTVAHEREQYRVALTYFSAALDQYRSIDYAAGELNALIDLVQTRLVLGEGERATPDLARAAELARSPALAHLQDRVTLLEAEARTQAGDLKGAQALLEPLLASTSRRGARPSGDRGVEAAAVVLRAELALRAGPTRAEDAARWVQRAGALAARASDPVLRGRSLRLSAALDALGGRDAAAADALARALAAYRGSYYRPGIAATHEQWAALLMQHGRWEEARRHLRRSLYVRLWMADRHHSMMVLARLAQVEQELGEADRAQALRDARRYLAGDGTVEWKSLRERIGADLQDTSALGR